MRKKLLMALLAVTASVTCALGLAACGEDEKKGAVWGEEYSVQAAYAVATELGYKGTLEEFIASISGKDGTDGEDGKDGKDGIDGINGKDGIDGKGIDKVEVNSDGEIVITFTDETTKNLGTLPDCKHSYTQWEKGLAPTCTSIGYDLRTCTKCGDKDYKIIEQTDHTWDDGVVLIKPTTKQTGLKLYSCTVCRTAKTEVLDKIEAMSEEEWRAAVHATIMSDNFTYEAESNSYSAAEPMCYEKVAFNLDEGVSSYYSDRIQDDCNYKETVYYKLDQVDRISFNKTSRTYKNDPLKNEIIGCVYSATESDYSNKDYKEHPEEVKFELDNHHYSSTLRPLGMQLTDNIWDGRLLEDAYECFEFDGETQSYVYVGKAGMIYSFKYADGYISEFCTYVEDQYGTKSMVMTFSDYGTTKVTVPQELIDEAHEKGLEYEYWYGLEPNTEIVVKPQYFGYNLTAIGASAFYGENGLIKITIPETVKTICGYAFYDCRNLKDIVFGGTKAQWEAIEKGENWDEGVTHYTVHCTDVDIEGLTTYNFEAELTDLTDFVGNGLSGSAVGKGAIVKDSGYANASGGFWVDYMYKQGCSLTFEFDSDKAVSDATLILRLSASFIEELILTEEDLVIEVNGQALQFGQIKISDIDPDINSRTHPFDDFTVGTALNLTQGKNIVTITVTGKRDYGAAAGTLQALAPMVDCIKITTTANLTWNPCTENLG